MHHAHSWHDINVTISYPNETQTHLKCINMLNKCKRNEKPHAHKWYDMVESMAIVWFGMRYATGNNLPDRIQQHVKRNWRRQEEKKTNRQRYTRQIKR